MIEWLESQHSFVLLALGFVLGTVFQALVNVLGREFSAWREEGRRHRRELRQAQLEAIDVTLEHVHTYTNYLIERVFGREPEYDEVRYKKARLSLIGDTALLERYHRSVSKFFPRTPGAPVPAEEVMELLSAREAVENVLAEQSDRVLAGKDPVLIPLDEANRITAMEPLYREQLERVLAESRREEAGEG